MQKSRPKAALDNLISGGYTEIRKRALPADGQPLMLELQEVTAQLGNWGRLLLFYLENQTDNADDDKRVSKKLTVCNHGLTSPPLQEGARSPLRDGGTNRLPLRIAPSPEYHTF